MRSFVASWIEVSTKLQKLENFVCLVHKDDKLEVVIINHSTIS